MDKFINEPVDYDWTEGDVIREYNKYMNKKIVAARFLISVSKVSEIIKKHNS